MRISRKPAAFPLLAALACSLLILSLAAAERGPAGTPAGALAPAEPPDGECFTVLVGRKASADGSVMVAHNEDDRGDIVVNLRKIAPGETGGGAAGLLWIEATTQEFADSFINEHGVLVTSDSCPSRVTAEDYTDGGIGGMLRRLVAEQATSARDAVRIAGELVEKHGYRASGRTYSIADRKEAWLLAVLRGRRWYAQRVPDDAVAVIPNHFTIRGIRPDDPDSFMGSRRHRRIRQNERLVRRGEGRAVRFQEGVRPALDPRARRRRERPAPLAGARAHHREALGAPPRLSVLGRTGQKGDPRSPDGHPPRSLRGNGIRRHGRLQDRHAEPDEVPDDLHGLDHQRLRRLPRRAAPRTPLRGRLAGHGQARHDRLPAGLLRRREPAGGRAVAQR